MDGGETAERVVSVLLQIRGAVYGGGGSQTDFRIREQSEADVDDRAAGVAASTRCVLINHFLFLLSAAALRPRPAHFFSSSAWACRFFFYTV